mmetsp:Transcript_12142/g.23695  ORF Transcript_12142/g.23695 Transcript_12142/m.23695 type:complete len:108 (+) Transcript_12142:994-1317(+)
MRSSGATTVFAMEPATPPAINLATCFSRSLRILLRCGSVEADSDVKEVWGTPTNASAPEGPFGAMTTPAPEGLSDMVKSALGLHSDQFRSTDSQQCVREFGIGILRA